MSIIIKSIRKDIVERITVMYDYVPETLIRTGQVFGGDSWQICKGGDAIRLPWTRIDEANEAYTLYKKEMDAVEIIEEAVKEYSDFRIKIKGVVETLRRYDAKKWRLMRRDTEVMAPISNPDLEEYYVKWREQREENRRVNMQNEWRD